MSRGLKIGLAVLTVAPLLWIGVFVTLILLSVASVAATDPHRGGPPPVFFAFFGLAVVGHVLIAMIALGLWVFYLIHVITNAKLDDKSKLIWALLVIFLHTMGMLVYWYACIWTQEGVSLGKSLGPSPSS